MIIKDVVVLREAADDLEAGRVFYDQREAGVGDYFWDSLIAGVESLSIFAGVHAKKNMHLQPPKLPFKLKNGSWSASRRAHGKNCSKI